LPKESKERLALQNTANFQEQKKERVPSSVLSIALFPRSSQNNTDKALPITGSVSFVLLLGESRMTQGGNLLLSNETLIFTN
jgi:hypothetical protein